MRLQVWHHETSTQRTLDRLITFSPHSSRHERHTSFGMLRLTISSHFQVRVQLLLQMPPELHVISINLYILEVLWEVKSTDLGVGVY